MAIRAFFRGVFVDHDFLVARRTRLRVTLGARDVGVPASQGKVRFSVVVKDGWRPAHGIVAVGAMCLIVFGQKLTVMGIIVAALALCWSALKA